MEPPSLRTSLQWLQSHGLTDDAECWILAGDTVEPVTDVTPTADGNIVLDSRPPWAEPSPVPLTYGAVYDTLIETYSGGGHLVWGWQPEQTYRGSYVVNPAASVFFLFLPEEIQIVESHSEKMEQRKQQAVDLTREIEKEQKPHGT